VSNVRAQREPGLVDGVERVARRVRAERRVRTREHSQTRRRGAVDDLEDLPEGGGATRALSALAYSSLRRKRSRAPVSASFTMSNHDDECSALCRYRELARPLVGGCQPDC
jgi:hypothetical protein